MSVIKYEVVLFSTPAGRHRYPRIFVEEPYSVLGDLSNIPSIAFPEIIPHIRKVMAGEEDISEFGWHRVQCYAEKEKTIVYDHHSEDMGTEPWFEVPTSEILKLLEDYWAFYQEWDAKR